MRRPMPIIEQGPRPGVVNVRKRRDLDGHLVDAAELARVLHKCADRADAGRPFVTVAALLLPGEHAVMVGGGLRGVVPTVDVWGKRGTWMMAPGQARVLAGEVLRQGGVDIRHTVRSGT